MERSEQINELVTALAKAQSEFKPIIKKTVNPHFGKKYADLAEVIAATQPALNKNGLAVIQYLRCLLETNITEVQTMLVHTSGQFVMETLQLPAGQQQRFDAQTVGSSQTYGRRYGWQAIVGVAADDDDDGNASVGANGSKAASQAVAERKIAEHEAKKPPAGARPDFLPAASTAPQSAKKPVKIAFSPDGKKMYFVEDYYAIEPELAKLGAVFNKTLLMLEIDKTRDVEVLKLIATKGLAIQNVPLTGPKKEKTTQISNGIIKSVKRLKRRGGNNQEYLVITQNGKDMTLWDNKEIDLGTRKAKLFEVLELAEGMEATFQIEVRGAFTNILGASKIGSQAWLDDGTPILQRGDEEPPIGEPPGELEGLPY